MKKSTFAKMVLASLMLSLSIMAPLAYATGNKQVTVPKSFGSSRIDSWKVIDRDTVVFDVFGFGELVAELFPGCTNLRFTGTLAIRDRAFELSRGSTLLLPGGERCSIRSLTRLEVEDSAEVDGQSAASDSD